jgi:predicted SnoaL-like aldol condensation-catalyzing enzyme
MFRTAGLISISLLLSLNLAHAGTPQEERNKANAIAFYNTQNTKDWAAARSYVADNYIEHHPKGPQGIPGIQALTNFYKALPILHPQHRVVIYRTLAEGNFVVLHIRDIEEPGLKGTALIAFYRFDENGKIAEHWHGLQPVAGVMNANGMF